jgi:hypothetical protein
LQQLEDALLQCGDLLDLVALTQGLQDGRLDIYGNYYNSIPMSIEYYYYYYYRRLLSQAFPSWYFS